MNRLVVVAACAALAAVAGCKGKTEYKDSQATLDKLSGCEKQLAEKEKYITLLNGQIADLKTGGAGDELVVTVEGEIEVKAGGSGGSSKKPANVDIAKHAAAFQKHVSGSHGAVKRCYNNALKKDSSLERRTITVEVTVRYKSTGKVQGVGLNKKINDNFAACMKSVADGWTIPEAPQSLAFKQSFALTPQ